MSTPTEALQIGNADFLRGIRGELEGDQHLWVCSFAEDPENGRWSGRAVLPGKPLHLPPEHNNYFSVASLVGGRRAGANFVRLLALVADDADRSKLRSPPSWVLRTSAHKQQIGFILRDDDPAVRDPMQCKVALQALVKRGLAAADKSGNNLVRYVRLPVGTNTKRTYLAPFPHELLEWRPEVRVTLAEALEAFGVSPDQPTEESVPPTVTSPPGTFGLSFLVSAMSALDPDMGREAWLHVGMALHHESGGSEEGLDAWDGWSSQSLVKYVGREDLETRWASFGRSSATPVTGGTLLRMAAEAGWAEPHEEIAKDFDVIPSAGDAAPSRFQVVPASAFSRGRPPGWLVKGVIPRAELVVLFGESGSGKSFLALDIGAAVARGVNWRGHRTAAGRVIYIAAEGGGGFRNRIKAYEIHHSTSFDGVPFGVIHAAPNLLQKADVIAVCKAIDAAGGADLIIVDTFAQTTPGANENAGEDVGKALSNCRGMHRATGAVVLLVHHAGKDLSRGARGWSGLRAAADAEIEVSRLGIGRLARSTKQKDGEDGIEWGFDLERVPVGMDEDGDVVESCVVIEAGVPTVMNANRRRPAGKWERLVMEVVGEVAFTQSVGIEINHVLAEVVRRSDAPEGGGRDTRKQQARRALEKLCEGEQPLYQIDDDCLTVIA
ncbi:AAA family ATPase [Zoogloea sp. LCSB751]|uniref:AAA family ATPase n=1 Tax=Zoogloea sp. LCSB751 TaxID=1965277 RepID=UPI0009A4D1D2|nr:AAA family ATPase [Zoogloea sp. LCSB751]